MVQLSPLDEPDHSHLVKTLWLKTIPLWLQTYLCGNVHLEAAQVQSGTRDFEGTHFLSRSKVATALHSYLRSEPD